MRKQKQKLQFQDPNNINYLLPTYFLKATSRCALPNVRSNNNKKITENRIPNQDCQDNGEEKARKQCYLFDGFQSHWFYEIQCSKVGNFDGPMPGSLGNYSMHRTWCKRGLLGEGRGVRTNKMTEADKWTCRQAVRSRTMRAEKGATERDGEAQRERIEGL